MFVDPDFPDEGFDLVWPHPDGDVLCQALERRTTKWAVRSGSSYQADQHTYAHFLIIDQGSGMICFDGIMHRYASGWSFWIGANVPHAFVRVDTPTLVYQIDEPSVKNMQSRSA